MATNNDIRYCLETHLSAIPRLPLIFNENLNNYPQNPVSHLSTKLIPTSNRAVTTGNDPYIKKMGFFKVLIRVPLNNGTGEQLDYADQIETFFGPGKFLTTNKTGPSLQMDFSSQLFSLEDKTTTVVIDYAEAFGSYEESPYYCTPVNIGWHCHNL